MKLQASVAFYKIASSHLCDLLATVGLLGPNSRDQGAKMFNDSHNRTGNTFEIG